MDLVTHLEGKLLFAVPKKGRLHENTLNLLEGSDIRFNREPRLDIALVTNLPIALVFLPAADIPTFVGSGRVDLGITGSDTVAEYHANVHDNAEHAPGNITEVMKLGFGKCKLQIQVPERGEIQEAKQLIGKRISTSFTGLAQKYFADLEAQEGQKGGATKISYIHGSVEASCALGVSDGIVDLVESGKTMKIAGLKAIDTVHESETVLIRSNQTSQKELVDRIQSRIRGVINAKRFVLCTYNIPKEKLPEASKITPGKRAPTVTSLEQSEWVAVSVMVPTDEVAHVMDDLEHVGASDILITRIMNSRTN